MNEKVISNNKNFTTDFELFFRMSIDVMLIADADGKILDFNHAFEKLTGYSREELFNLHGGWGLIHPSDLNYAREQVVKLNAGNFDMINYEVRLLCKDESTRIVSFDGSIDKINQLIYVIGRDVSEERAQQDRLKQSELRLKFFFENAFDGMSILFEDKLQDVNKAFLEIVGYESDAEIIGKNFLDFVEPLFHEIVKKLDSGDSEEICKIRIIRKDGSLRNVEKTGKWLQTGDKILRIAVIRDLDERNKAQEMIEESEKRFKAVFQNSSLGIMITDYDGNFVDANSTILKRFGFTQNEIKNLNLLDLVFEEDKASTKSYIDRLIMGSVDKTYMEKRFLRKDKSLTWVRITCSLMTISISQNLILILVEDLDSQKKSEKALIESEEKFRAVYESSPMGILITKSPGVIIDMNPAFADMMGYEETDLKGKNLLDITHSADFAKTKQLLHRIYSKEIQTYITEKRYIKKDGTALWAKAVVSTMNDLTDEVITVSIIENIENKKQTEGALEQKNRELIQINQELEHFAYVASHDLQEPLRTITSFIQILDKRYVSKLDEDAQQFMEYVVEGAKRMQTLIHDLLEYSRINRLNTGYEKIDLNEIFNTINRVLKDKIETHDAVILSENLPVVYGNRLQLTQVFQNLVDNAIKFKSPKRKPEIIISVNDLGEKWELIFKDNGIGISQEYFQRIFIIFQRLHTHEEYTGTGIGLAICKKIIERHGGEIWVDSKPEKGSIFHLTIAKKLMRAVG